MENWFDFVSEVGNSSSSLCSNSGKRKALSYSDEQEPGKKSVVVVMSSLIWFTIKGLYLA
jgi:hypothetical protein